MRSKGGTTKKLRVEIRLNTHISFVFSHYFQYSLILVEKNVNRLRAQPNVTRLDKKNHSQQKQTVYIKKKISYCIKEVIGIFCFLRFLGIPKYRFYKDK